MDERELIIATAAELRSAPTIELNLPAAQLFWLIGLLQLALRHPCVDHEAHELVRDLAEQMRPIGPATFQMIEIGFRPECDV
jgi:hypothetical protein